MSVVADIPDRLCSTLGCRDGATVVIDHPEKGRRTACDDCAEGHPIVSEDPTDV